MKEEEMDDFCVKYISAYKASDYGTLKLLLHKKDVQEVYQDRAMLLIDSVCGYFLEKKNPSSELEELSEILINQIIEHSRPKESLIALLEHIERCGLTNKFALMLRLVQKSLKRFDHQKRILSTTWALQSISDITMKLELPDYSGLDEKERILVDSSEENLFIVDFLKQIYLFLEPFISEVCVHTNVLNGFIITKTRHTLQKGILVVFEHPLVYLDLHSTTDSSPKVMKYVRQMIKLLSEVQADFLKLLTYDKVKDPTEEKKKWNLALANLFYLLLCEDVTFYLPLIYSHLYLLECALPFIAELLENSNSMVRLKGLYILQSFMPKIKKESLGFMHFSLQDHSKMYRNLQSTIIYADLQDVRSLALNVYEQYVNLFDVSAQFILLRQVLNVSTHSGLRGKAITMIKDRFVRCYRYRLSPMFERYFEGLLTQMTQLRCGIETDLLDNYDEIFASLNALQCFLIMDSVNNLGLKNMIPSIQESFLKPLQKGIDLSKAHWDLKLRELKEGNKADAPPYDIVVSGQKLGALSLETQKEIVLKGLLDMDFMNAILARTNECVSAYLNKHK
ncbi:hypothetical protein QYM36_003214 [Artemia franciscana]|uniref:Glomulin n=1 Tax=Artemia franciscana TaxID=6661 RepID=A0AA88I7Q4_ARTSF|nr:hypothetical protein QYM36_003214 [Artemia franciscana]